jgi:hypothetical protein
MPRSLYRELLEPGFAIKQIVVLSGDKTNQSAQQFSMHLLCQACEIRFQKGGEDWTLGNRYRSDGSFPLRDLLLNAVPSETKPDGSRVYGARTVAGLAVDCAAMDNALTSRATLVGHLTLTAPAIAGILLVPFFGLRMFGPSLFLYYVMASIALGWQWYLVALPNWKKWLTAKGAQPRE